MSAVISVVDDDESVRESLPDLLREFGFAVHAFASAEDFLASGCLGRTDCIVLDIAMSGMSGIDMMRKLRRENDSTPIVFITAQQEEGLSERLSATGSECLLKPFSQTDLRRAIEDALSRADQSASPPSRTS